jgi:hypothetical protein
LFAVITGFQASGRQNNRAGQSRAPGEFCNDVHLRVVDHGLPIGGHIGNRYFAGVVLKGFDRDFTKDSPSRQCAKPSAPVEVQGVNTPLPTVPPPIMPSSPAA